MDGHDNASDTSLCDEHSVFSFFPEKADMKNKSTNTQSQTTNSKTNSPLNFRAVYKKPEELRIESEDILSMIDFFVGAWDYDSQATTKESGVAENRDKGQLDRDSVFSDHYTSTGVDLHNLNFTKELNKIKRYRIRKIAKAKDGAYFKHRPELQTTFMNFRTSFRRCLPDRL